MFLVEKSRKLFQYLTYYNFIIMKYPVL